MYFLTGQGIGDSVWALFKLQSIAAKHQSTHIALSVAVGRNDDHVQSRALEFLRRFKFLDSVGLYRIKPQKGREGVILAAGAPTDRLGRYNYIPDGPPSPGLQLHGIQFVAIPNGSLERGMRLEKWLPNYAMRWDIFKDFEFTAEEKLVADEFAAAHGRFAAFYMGSLTGNTTSGHNRGPIWTPEAWLKLGTELHERYGLKILVVGADYDRSYWETRIRPLLPVDSSCWLERIGAWPNPCRTFAVLKRAALVVSYQSGIGIVSHYLGIPTAVFWRPDGDSLSSKRLISFSENMAHAWAYPTWEKDGKLLPCIYGKHGVSYLLSEFDKRGWAAKETATHALP